MIEIHDGRFSFDGRTAIFSGLNFSVREGETLAILGANGIGKTTLLRCMMRFLKFERGEMKILGKNSSQISNAAFWRHVSYVPQAKNLVFGYSVLKMVVMGRSQYVGFGRTPSKKDYANAMDLLAEFELDHLANRSCNKLSGGQLQMVLIARALAKDPSILIMDEPESHLDMKNQLKVLGIVETLSHVKNITVVINTHFPAHALRCADKTLLLGGANRYSFGSTKNVINSKTIETFFDTHAKVVHVEKEGKKFCGIIPMEIVQAKGDKITDE